MSSFLAGITLCPGANWGGAAAAGALRRAWLEDAEPVNEESRLGRGRGRLARRWRCSRELGASAET